MITNSDVVAASQAPFDVRLGAGTDDVERPIAVSSSVTVSTSAFLGTSQQWIRASKTYVEVGHFVCCCHVHQSAEGKHKKHESQQVGPHREMRAGCRVMFFLLLSRASSLWTKPSVTKPDRVVGFKTFPAHTIARWRQQVEGKSCSVTW